MKKSKNYLYTDLDSYNRFKELEDNAVNLFNGMKKQATETLGDFDVNYIEFMDQPVKYLVSNYWTMANRPKHLEPKAKTICVNDTFIC